MRHKENARARGDGSGALRSLRERLFGREQRRGWIFLAATLLSVLGLVLLAVFLPRPDAAQSYESYMKQAAESYQLEDYDSALRSLRKAGELNRTEACLMLMADCYEAQGNLDKALETLRQMDTGDSTVARRIASLEQRRMQEGQGEQLLIAGQSFAPDTTSLALNDLGLSDGVLPEVAKLYALNTLSLKNNELRDLTALSGLGGLDTLDLSGNQIRELGPLAKLENLRRLVLDGNPLADLSPLYNLKQLSLLSIRDMELDKNAVLALSEALPGCAIELGSGEVYDILLGGVSFHSDAVDLNLSGRGIREISVLADCKQLRSLDISGNQISDLQPLMNLPELEVLNLADNQVSDLRPLMGMGKLYSVNASANSISDTAALASLSAMSSLNLSGNPISDFSGLSKLANLQTLRLADTGIADEDLPALEGLAMLRLLVLDQNDGLSDVAVGHLQSMLPSCVISHSELAYLIRIGANELRSDAVDLDLSDQGMESLNGIERFTRLETVDLSGNNLRGVSELQYCNSRGSLRSLDLNNNQIESVAALTALTALEELDLSHNRLSDATPLYQLSSLRSLRIGGNLLSPEQLEELQAALPECQVRIDD